MFASSRDTDQRTAAAVSICQAVPHVMNDQGLLPVDEGSTDLRDDRATHENVSRRDAEREAHQAVADIGNRFMPAGDSARRR